MWARPSGWKKKGGRSLPLMPYAAFLPDSAVGLLSPK